MINLKVKNSTIWVFAIVTVVATVFCIIQAFYNNNFIGNSKVVTATKVSEVNHNFLEKSRKEGTLVRYEYIVDGSEYQLQRNLSELSNVEIENSINVVYEITNPSNAKYFPEGESLESERNGWIIGAAAVFTVGSIITALCVRFR